MKFCALASGSSGNCFYVKNDSCGIIIDAGISARQIVERLSCIKEQPESIKAIFITHEHTDHINGADVLASKFKIPIYGTRKTIKNINLKRSDGLVNYIKSNESVKLGDTCVRAFPKSHDAAEPVSFCIESGGKCLSVITDIGYACKNVIEHVSCSDSLILESNHDSFMLKNGPYPEHLKKRIASDKGHISNYASALLVLQHASPKLQNLILSHLSIHNNSPEIALRTFNLIKERKDLCPQIKLSERYNVSDYLRVK